MGNLNKVVYLTNAQAQTLFANGTITVDGVTVAYSADDLYVTPSGEVTDVQVDGTSVVSNGVASIPPGVGSKLGLAKASSPYGTTFAANGSGTLMLVSAGDSVIKAASGSGSLYQPIVPYHQHKSVFYGLAKAAGDTTQSTSSNAVGEYTDEAKVAIQKMLNAQGQWREEGSLEVVADTTSVEFEFDYEATEVFIWASIVASTGTTSLAFYAKDSSNATVKHQFFSSQIATSQKSTLIHLQLTGTSGCILDYNTDNANSQMRRGFTSFDTPVNFIKKVSLSAYDSTTPIPVGSKFKVYAR